MGGLRAMGGLTGGIADGTCGARCDGIERHDGK